MANVKNQLVPKDMSDSVLNRVNELVDAGQLVLPNNYHVGNAMKEAWLIFSQDSKLMACSRESVMQSLLDMSLMGLSPAKKQVYFIAYGTKATAMPSYFGRIQILRRIEGIKDVVSDVIYEGTEYELVVNEYGEETIKITKACPLDKRSGDNIVGAWATIILDEDIFMREKFTTIMTMDEIKKSWGQGATKGNSPAHKNFPQEMSKKSVLNRCVKSFINTFAGETSENALVEVLHKTAEVEYELVQNDEEVYKDKVISFEEETGEVNETSEDHEEVTEVAESEVVETVEKPTKSKKNKYEDIDMDLDF